MASRFEHLHQRDCSVSMLRVKMSRRRSQTQKENRERVYKLRRNLDNVPELEISQDITVLEDELTSTHGITSESRQAKNAENVNSAAEERKKLLARYKEAKLLQKEKEKRAKEKKGGVFKVGIYKPQPLGYLPLNPVVQTKTKTTEMTQSVRVTRSMSQYGQKALTERQTTQKKGQSSARAPTIRSVSRVPAKVAVSVSKPVSEDTMALRTRSTRSQLAAPSASQGGAARGNRGINPQHLKPKSAEVQSGIAMDPAHKEKMTEEDPKRIEPAETSSFAPQDFVFRPPTGLCTFQPAPLSPRSTSAFLSPSTESTMELIFLPHPHNDSSTPPPCSSTPPSLPNPPLPSDHPDVHPHLSPPPLSTTPPVIPAPSEPQEPQHDVPYFRAARASETDRLTRLSEMWETRFDDITIPEEMRDHMRTAVGQARLLIKERFGQFSGLVDDCELGRGEKVTTCMDLQGFWDMVYFQVEDVNRKFDALKAAEARGWQEESKPPPRQKKVAKKPPIAAGRMGAGAGVGTAAKSRLAAVKAAMKAKMAATERAAPAAGASQDEPVPAIDPAPASELPPDTLTPHTIVFQGGFFQVESPVRLPGALRRSSRVSAVPTPHASPCAAQLTTPARQRRPAAGPHYSPMPSMPTQTQHTDHTSCTPERVARTASVQSEPPTRSVTNPMELLEDQSSQSGTGQLPQSPDQRDCTGKLERAAEAESPSTSPRPGASQVAVHPLWLTPSPCKSPTALAPAATVDTLEVLPQSCLMSLTLACDQAQSPALCSPDNTGAEMRENPGASSTEEAMSLDLRYLQTTRCSLSPGVSKVTPSPTATDVEMESPVHQSDEQTQETPLTPTAPCSLPQLLFTPGTEKANDSNLLLFTPEQRGRARPSVFDHDLMMFTPPSNK